MPQSLVLEVLKTEAKSDAAPSANPIIRVSSRRQVEFSHPVYVVATPIQCTSSSLVLIILLRVQSSTLTSLLPRLNLAPRTLALRLQLIIASAELCNSLLGKKLLKRPLLDVLVLVLFQLSDELDGALEDGTLVLLAAWDDLGELVDAFVDGFASSALNC